MQTAQIIIKKKENKCSISYIYIYIYNTRNKQKQSAQPEIANNKIDRSRKILSSKNLYTWP